MAELYQNGEVSRKFPLGWNKNDGRGSESHRKRIDRVGDHTGRPSEEDNEQCAEHKGPDSCERVRGFFGLKETKCQTS